MACFYIATTRYKGEGVLKFGISKFNDPVRRLSAHGSTLDNPFRSRLPSFVLCTWILIDDLDVARAIESAIKRRVLGPRNAGARLSVIGGETASGEWLSFAGHDLWSAVWELLCVSCNAMVPALFGRATPSIACGLSDDERARAHRIFCRASERWYDSRLVLSYDDDEDLEERGSREAEASQ